MDADVKLESAEQSMDHLLLGVGDLDRGIEWFESLTGVKAVRGGSHPGVGTQNALISLGGRRYLEIIAPDPAQPTFRFRIDIRALAAPRLISWAATTKNTGSIPRVAQGAGYPSVGPEDGSRARPDGKALSWSVVRVENPFDRLGIEAVPFFINWAKDSEHPSQDSPTGCELVSFHIVHPDPTGLANVLKRFGIRARVERGAEVRLVAGLHAPKGSVEIS